jgi:hypothetical protein
LFTTYYLSMESCRFYDSGVRLYIRILSLIPRLFSPKLFHFPHGCSSHSFA